MTILDTHVLIWWISDPDKISQKVKRLINKEIKNGKIGVSSISVWEIYMLVKRGRLKLSMDTDKWVEKIENLPFIEFIPVNNKIASSSVNLPGQFHLDPADRMIVATARERGATLLTSDQKIRKYPSVKSLW